MISHPRRVAAAVGSALAVAVAGLITVTDANAAVAPVRFADGTVFASLGNGNGTFTPPTSSPSTPPVQLSGELADFNRDGTWTSW